MVACVQQFGILPTGIEPACSIQRSALVVREVGDHTLPAGYSSGRNASGIGIASAPDWAVCGIPQGTGRLGPTRTSAIAPTGGGFLSGSECLVDSCQLPRPGNETRGGAYHCLLSAHP